jgi:UDP-N-acetylmuramate--alanine ligase
MFAPNALRQRKVERIHFVGIGGAGMGGIAEVLHNLEFVVTGSDLKESAMTQRLAALGIDISLGHDAARIAGSGVVVYSSAVAQDNPELAAARAARIPVIPRAEMLAELMRFSFGIAVAGTHGKTTTTSLVAACLSEGGLDPTYVIGGRLISTNSHARLGSGQYLVAEADESDASFLHLEPMMAVLTNIDADHMETYGGDLGVLRAAFTEFLNRLPFYGLACICLDDPEAARILPDLLKPVRTYGTHPAADVRVKDIQQSGTITRFSFRRPADREWIPVLLNLPGRHNVMNATAAIVIASDLGVDDAAILRALAGFQGIARRCQILGQIQAGAGAALLVDDYGHHPREIAATLETIRAGWPGRRLVVVFQPHRYTRTRDLFEDFAAILSTADFLILAEVYAAGERPIRGADGRALSRAIRVRGAVDPIFVERLLDEVPRILPQILQEGDVLLCLGAGNVGELGPRLMERFGVDAGVVDGDGMGTGADAGVGAGGAGQ